MGVPLESELIIMDKSHKSSRLYALLCLSSTTVLGLDVFSPQEMDVYITLF